MLRQEHPVFQSPDTVQFTDSIEIDVPDAWAHRMEKTSIQVLPLVKDTERTFPDGWCTYTYEHLQAPELEIICGGINAKTPKASAIWRQGNLLHFGFEQSPAEMNANGNAMLVNSICYIARFQQDRPIIRRSAQGRYFDRGAIGRLIQNRNRDLAPYLRMFFPPGELRDELGEMTRDELAQWFEKTRGYLSADERGKFFVDERARQFGVAPDSDKFIPTAIADIQSEGEQRELAVELLQRYVPEGPSELSPQKWQSWWDENQRYVFFSDSGGFRWYLDPLAKKRGARVNTITGQARADNEEVGGQESSGQ